MYIPNKDDLPSNERLTMFCLLQGKCQKVENQIIARRDFYLSVVDNGTQIVKQFLCYVTTDVGSHYKVYVEIGDDLIALEKSLPITALEYRESVERIMLQVLDTFPKPTNPFCLSVSELLDGGDVYICTTAIGKVKKSKSKLTTEREGNVCRTITI